MTAPDLETLYWLATDLIEEINQYGVAQTDSEGEFGPETAVGRLENYLSKLKPQIEDNVD